MASPTLWTREQSPGGGDGQGSLECCSPWGHKESDMSERLNNNNTLLFTIIFLYNCLVKAMVFPVVMYGCEFEQAPGVGEGQGSLACCSPWCRKETQLSD